MQHAMVSRPPILRLAPPHVADDIVEAAWAVWQRECDGPAVDRLLASTKQWLGSALSEDQLADIAYEYGVRWTLEDIACAIVDEARETGRCPVELVNCKTGRE